MSIWLWIGFLFFIVLMLSLDLGVFHRKTHFIKIREAFLWSAFWIALALAFTVVIYYMYENHWLDIGSKELDGKKAAMQFLTGYIIEKSLSLDNIFVIALIFSYFKVPVISQHRVLFLGILGALIMRGIMIGAGAALIQRFSWMVYVFGGFLILTAVKMLIARHDNLEPDKNLLVKLVRRFYPVSTDFYGQHFFTKINEKRAMTPLFIALIVVESSDVLFAVDSIPAIFAITLDPFIIFTSNVFAILGLRSLFFVLAAVMEKFRYLKISLVFILAYVGAKMLITHHFPIPAWVSLIIIGSILSVGILASVYSNKGDDSK